MADNILTKILKPGAKGKIWRNFLFILLLVIIAGGVVGGKYYNEMFDKINNFTGLNLRIKEIPFRLGLDLVGGTHLVYVADTSKVADSEKVSAIEGVRDVIERRVNAFGVSEPVVQTNFSGGKYSVIVELAGVKDVNEAINMIGETPLLEFKEQSNEPVKLTDEEKSILDQSNKAVQDAVAEALQKLKAGGDFLEIAKEYNTDEALKASGGDLGYILENDNPVAVNAVKDFKIGKYTKDIIDSGNALFLFRLEDKRDRANPFDGNAIEKEVKAAHLLVCYAGAENCQSGLTKEEAYTKIKSLQTQATPQNFSQLVRANSTEPGAAQSGGELGWFAKNAMVKPFEDAVFPQKVGIISFIVETKFGYHLIYKEDERNLQEYKIREIKFIQTTEQDIVGSQENWKNTELSGKNLKRALLTFNPNDNMPEVSLEFDDEGAKMFADITERNVGKPVAIFLDELPISIPNVNEKIPDGKAVISGNFDYQKAKLLVQRLNTGALPIPVSLASQRTVGASLGQQSIKDSLMAGLVGFFLIAIFMILFYRLPGVMSVLALAVYGLISLFIFKIFSVTLSLSGLAGFILSVGMAVDANVLIFSRLREELNLGKPLVAALEDGFRRAWPSIRDSNASTLITCLILFQFATSMVRGFAVTLAIGIGVSIFSAILVTRSFLRLIPTSVLEKKTWLIGGIKK
jgi:preprotein translocase subunit SecD